MAEWKKIIVSGSDAPLNSVTVGSQALTTAAATTKLSGSFTGSFVGDGSGLTGVSAAGTVSSSAQIDITQTTNYTTFSSSLATVDAGQNIRIDNLASLTSSYALQSQLAGVASSSSQVKTYLPADTVSSSTQVVAFLPAGTVSSSGQVDITATTNYSTFSSSLATVDAIQQVSLNALNTATSSYALQSQLAGVASSSSQVKAFLPAGTVSSSDQVALSSISGTTFSSSNFTFPANLTVSGDLFVDGTTTTVNTTNLNIEDRFILVNSGSVLGGNAQGGLVVQDGGANPSGSAFFYTTTGATNRWGLADNVGYNAASATQTAYMSAVVDMNVAVQSASLATYAKVGNIRVDTNGDIFIYSA